ncbi:DUF1194 domain-containing protein [Pseudaminobacter soli (ex Li et al. 2025)]|uniref:DUF1194 domain-containing protein n=1 Tax=Pseudaminobacter soli (ex Li et al. 2025) TaxID=1295366 RepID=A0A2P7SMW0_9HYPH|nr:DUF1194 domain-containing protein [Mesorhizobium soli]PSJ63830.1 hypothetical protein C7I85_01510 [Mesorhizobium soli]
MSRLARARHVLSGVVAAALSLFFVFQSHAAEAVDVELVLAVDVSLSMSPAELQKQRLGYAAAFTGDRVIEAIAAGKHRRIAVTYFEWSGATMQRVVVPWMVVSSRADAQHFASQLAAIPPAGGERTSISGALEYASGLFRKSPYRAPRKIIDISGDGPNDHGAPVNRARDAAVRRGIVINGLPMMIRGRSINHRYEMADLDQYYAGCVIGGTGSFMMPVNSWSQFPAVLQRKLVLELRERTSGVWRAEANGEGLPVVPVAAAVRAPVDCMIGERLWLERPWKPWDHLHVWNPWVWGPH